MTAKRAAILQVLRESEGHLTADEIYRLAQEKYPGIVLATVYNNLHYLTEQGHIKHIKTAEGPDFYDKTPTPLRNRVYDRLIRRFRHRLHCRRCVLLQLGKCRIRWGIVV